MLMVFRLQNAATEPISVGSVGVKMLQRSQELPIDTHHVSGRSFKNKEV
jgi:hypothetical protein